MQNIQGNGEILKKISFEIMNIIKNKYFVGLSWEEFAKLAGTNKGSIYYNKSLSKLFQWTNELIKNNIALEEQQKAMDFCAELVADKIKNACTVEKVTKKLILGGE